MDGGGRLLRSLGGFGTQLAPATYALAAPGAAYAPPSYDDVAPRLPQRRWRRNPAVSAVLTRIAATRFLGTALALSVICGSAAYGMVRGGAYADFVAAQGSLPDIAAKAAGFAIKAITITGTRELTEAEILDMAGVGPRNSLVFLDVADVRARLKAVPLIKDANVSKLYPNRLLIEIEERQPTALWQKDGAVSLVAADGTPIDDLKDPRFQRLPLVVGGDANKHLDEYAEVLDAAGELRDRIRAGIYVAGRRWTLKTDSGLAIDLPEKDPADAVARLALLEHDGHILEKDVLSLDLRIAGRVVARLSADAAAARVDALAKKTAKKKGATT